MKKYFLLYLILYSTVLAQDSLQIDEESSSTFFNKKNLSIIGISTVYISSLLDAYHLWWKDNSRSFNFYKTNEGEGWLSDPNSLGIDKVGHFYTSYFFYHAQKNILRWGGHSASFSIWFSAGLTGGLAVLIELGDAFSTYGFDYQDLIFNLGGLGFALLQDIDPFFKNFNFKWSFIPKEGYTFPPRFTEHYSGHIYWLGVDIHNLFKNSVGVYWPEFLQPAIGFSISGGVPNKREFVVGLDFNLEGIFKTEDINWNLLIKTANMLHFPAPGIKYSSNRAPDYRLLLLN